MYLVTPTKAGERSVPVFMSASFRRFPERLLHFLYEGVFPTPSGRFPDKPQASFYVLHLFALERRLREGKLKTETRMLV